MCDWLGDSIHNKRHDRTGKARFRDRVPAQFKFNVATSMFKLQC